MLLFMLSAFADEPKTEPKSDSPSEETGGEQSETPTETQAEQPPKPTSTKEEPKTDSVQASSTKNIPKEKSNYPHIIVGIETGAAFSVSELQAAFLPQLHVGIQFPYWNERLGLIFHGSYHQAKLEGGGDSTTLTTGSYDFTMEQKEGELSLGLRIIFPEVPVVTPEIWIGPTMQLTHSEIQTTSGEAFPMTQEEKTEVGIHFAALGSYPLPAGFVFGGIHYTTYEWQQTIHGAVRNHAISPTVGYRYRFF